MKPQETIIQSLPGSSHVLHYRYAAWLVLSVSLLITFFAWRTANTLSASLADERFDNHLRELASDISYRMKLYEQALWGGVGVFNVANEVSREDWRTYVETLAISKSLPGIQGIGFGQKVTRNQEKAHEERVRSEGFPDYQLKPEGKRDIYCPVLYLEPFDWRNQRAFGYDMWSNPVRRDALDRSMVTGEAATSGLVRLVQETNEDVQNGFLTYLPVYKTNAPASTPEERRDALIGWVYGAFRVNDLMDGILRRREDDFRLKIYDGEKICPDALLFDSSPSVGESVDDHPSSVHRSMSHIILQGRIWTLDLCTLEAFEKKNRFKMPILVGLGGIITSAFLSYLVWALTGINRRAEALATKMTEKLAESNQELRQFAYAATHDVKSPLNSIGNALHLLNKDSPELSKRSSKAIEWIHIAHTRAIGILDKLTEVVCLKEGGKLIPDVIDVQAEVIKIAGGFERELMECEGSIDWTSCEGSVVFPRSVLVRVLENLLSNAIKYRSPDRPLRITVELTQHASQSVLRIQDNGIGFDSSSESSKVFGLFRRAHNHVEGTGFGLYITKQSLEFYGASISCTSAVDVGSAFSVTFPSGDSNPPT